MASAVQRQNRATIPDVRVTSQVNALAASVTLINNRNIQGYCESVVGPVTESRGSVTVQGHGAMRLVGMSRKTS